ncbi:MAG: hypothetical protein GX640_13230 [Fibrobacter sp.]|nr:hypothetical protein [Fibrobacter sp.]
MELGNTSSANSVSSGLKRIKPGIFDAVVFNHANLTLCLNLQNILNFYIDCLGKIIASSVSEKPLLQHLSSCLKQLEKFNSEYENVLDPEIKRPLLEFMDEAHLLDNMVNNYLAKYQQALSPHSLKMQLIAKSSLLQWLVVCILEELKKLYF